MEGNVTLDPTRLVIAALIGLALSVFRGDSVAREEPGGPLPQRKRLRLRIEYQ